MLRTNLRKPDAPVYREIVKQAFLAAWHDRHLWPLAFITSFLLTAGVYDVFWKTFDTISAQETSITEGGKIISSIGNSLVQAIAKGNDVLNVVFGLQFLLILSVLIVTVAAFSCVTQAGLVYALGARRRGEAAGILDALRVGGKAFWPVAAINALSLTLIWVLRFLVAIPLALNLASGGNSHWILYLCSFILFFALQFVVIIVQIFALNALVLQGTTAAKSIIRGYEMFKKHWLITIETAFLQTLIALGLMIAFCGFVFVATIPIIMAIITSATLEAASLYYLATGIGFGVLFLAVCAGIAFLTQFQYATWTFLYRRLGEGGTLPKLHRWYRRLTGKYTFEK